MMVEESKDAAEEQAGEKKEDKQRRMERMDSFYKGTEEEPSVSPPRTEEPKTPSLTEADTVFRSEFNTIGYLAIGFSLIAFLLIGIMFFRPPKPEAELQALAEAQSETRAALEELSGRISALDRRTDRSQQSDLVRNLRITHLALSELKERGNPGIQAEAEGLQAKIEELLEEVERGSRAGKSP